MSSDIVVLEAGSKTGNLTKRNSAVVRNGGIRIDPALASATRTRSENAELVLRVFQLVDEHRLEEMVGLLTADVDFFNPLGNLTGRDAVMGNFAPMKVAFPDSRHIIPNVHVSGNVVALEGEWTGTNSGPIPTPSGEIATGRIVRFPFAAICKVQDGLLSQVHIYHDLVVMYRQLGLM